MKNNQPVTQREQPLPPARQLISTTDLKGVVTSANEAFVEVSGFSHAELIGRSHNVVRHPDMPPAAFQDLWDSLKRGQPWMGLVKNRCKNGDHYYVDAYVTPMFEGGEVVGYQSVRVEPERAVVARAERLYARLRAGRGTGGLRWLQSYRGKASLVALLAVLPALVLGQWLVAALTAVAALAGVAWLAAPVLGLAGRARALFANPLAQIVYTGRGDEIGAIEAALLALRAQNRTILGRVSYTVETLGGVAQDTNNIVEATTQGVRRQQAELDMVATAMNEMNATVHEVARNAEETARASQDVLTQTSAGDRLVRDSQADIESLSRAVEEARLVIEKLREESRSIGSVVDVISKIASETNLLALNAAIEAARAGEQGRGFAVVADEVRNLASHTQQSTDEIQQMVKQIQQSADAAVDVMQQGQTRAQTSVEISRQVGSAFGEISDAIGRITQMNTQVATASEEQNAVTGEIHRNLVHISSVASDTLSHAEQTAQTSARLNRLVGDLQSVLRQFGSV
jgi:aerotaxis receptor